MTFNPVDASKAFPPVADKRFVLTVLDREACSTFEAKEKIDSGRGHLAVRHHLNLWRSRRAAGSKRKLLAIWIGAQHKGKRTWAGAYRIVENPGD